MEPLDEKELNLLLRRWEAPAAPPNLERRVLPRHKPSWRWLLTGTIRVPVPIGIATVLLVTLWTFSGARQPADQPADQPASAVSLADFQPVPQLEPRIVRTQQ